MRMKLSLKTASNVTGGILLLVAVFLLLFEGVNVSAEDAENLLKNPGAETQILAETAEKELRLSYFTSRAATLKLSDAVPADWGVYNQAENNVMLWGSTEKEAHSGKRSCFLKFVEKKDAGKKSEDNMYEYILLGGGGYGSGKSAVDVSPNVEYAYTFWIKGDVPKIHLKVFTWNTKEGDKGMTIASPLYGIDVSENWREVAGSFKTAGDVAKASVAIQVPAAKPGQTIFVDDARLCAKPQAVFKKKAGDPLKVAVYKTDSFEKFGAASIQKALEESGAFKVDAIDTLAPDAIKDYDVLVISTTRELSQKDTHNKDLGIKQLDIASSLLNFVDGGGGLVLGHDCVGYRGVWKQRLARAVCFGDGKSESRKVVLSEVAHPVTDGAEKAFEHSYYDHVTLKAGPKGSVLAKDENGASVIVAGGLSRGRIVGIGYPMGLKREAGGAVDERVPLTDAEKNILANAVKWCGAADKYAIPMMLTEMTLLQEINDEKEQKIETEKRRQEEEVKAYMKLPPPKPFDDSAIFISGHLNKTDKEVAQLIENCRKMGFKKALLFMNAASPFYKSDACPDELEGKAYVDAFSSVLRETRKQGMKLALVFCPWRIESRTKLPMCILPEERAKLNLGCSMDEILKAKSFNASWCCPDHPNCQKRALAITEEAIKKLRPDEMWFDYVRYPYGYANPCYCDYSLAKKAEFAKDHPEIKQEDLDEAFAKRQLVGFFTELAEFCKEIDPKIKTGCYTYATEWTFAYPFDCHTRNVSSHLNSDWPLDRVVSDTMKCSALMKELNPKGYFMPLFSCYDRKSGDRIRAELRAVSSAFDKIGGGPRTLGFFSYDMLIKDKKTGELDEDVAKAFSEALGGTWK